LKRFSYDVWIVKISNSLMLVLLIVCLGQLLGWHFRALDVVWLLIVATLLLSGIKVK